MNKERLLQLADHIELLLLPYQFSMKDWFQEDKQCGTVACVAGWATQLWPEEIQHCPGTAKIDYSISAANMLGLDEETAANLFAPVPPTDVQHLSPYFGDRRKDAARVLRQLAETGTVDWRISE